MRVVNCGKHVHCWSSPSPKDPVDYFGWRLHPVVMGWFGQDRRSARPIKFKQPGMCLAQMAMSCKNRELCLERSVGDSRCKKRQSILARTNGSE